MPNNYILLETIALTQSAASVTFDNLPTSGYTDLKIVCSTRTSGSGVGTLQYTFNGVTSGYTNRLLDGDGSSATSATGGTSFTHGGIVNTSSQTANTFSSSEMYIPNYRSSNNKSTSNDSASENNATAAYIRLGAGLWSNTAAITSINIYPESGYGSFVANSTFSLYGIAAFGTTPVLAPKATGGNIVANDGTYWYHAFTSSGRFVPQVGLTADCLVIAGGGGGGYQQAGGGGAGGLLAFTSQALTATNYNVTVGAGGAGASSLGQGTNGVDSQFATLTLVKGGGGGGAGGAGTAPQTIDDGKDGGSGGGGGNPTTGTGTAGNPTSGQGFAGGSGSSDNATYRNGGGGGGVGGAGVSSTSAVTVGTGGAGSSTYSSWATATSTGVSGAYAGGGGGGGNSRGLASAGGGDGATNVAGATGTANTGGGGGGGGYSSMINGYSGGSGIVIIRYPIA